MADRKDLPTIPGLDLTETAGALPNAIAGMQEGLARAENWKDRNGVQDTAVGILDTLQSIGTIPLAVLPNYELANAARNSQTLDEFRSAAYLQERATDADAVRQATEQGGEFAGLIEGASRAVTGGNTFADVAAQSPYLMIGPAARAMGFAAATRVPGVVGRGLAAIGGTSEGAIVNRVAALSGVLEGTSSYGQTYEQVLRETGDAAEATRQAEIAGGAALAAGLLLGKLTPGFEMDPTGLRHTKLTSQFLADAIKPTLGAVVGEGVEEGGMAVVNTVATNVMNGRDPLEGVGGQVGQAVATSSLFTGGMRSPGLVRDMSRAVGMGVVKGLKAVGGLAASKAVTPEGQAVAAAQAANAADAAAAFDASINSAVGGDPTSTAGSNTTSEAERVIKEDAASTQDNVPAGESYQLNLGEAPVREIKNEPTPVDTVLTAADTEEIIAKNTDENGDVNAEGAAAIERANTLEEIGKVAEAEALIEKISQDPVQVEQTVEAANKGNPRAQATVEAIAAVNTTALPDSVIPEPMRPFVQRLRDLALPKPAAPDTKASRIDAIREQLLNSGWVNNVTGKAAARRRGMRDHIQGILRGLRAGNAEDSTQPVQQAVTAAGFLQHLQQRGKAFNDALALAQDIMDKGKDHPNWADYNENQFIEVAGTDTLGKDGKLSGEPFKIHISNWDKFNSSRNAVEAVLSDVVAAEKMWGAFEASYPQMAAAALDQAGVQRQKLEDIIESRKQRAAAANAPEETAAEKQQKAEAEAAKREEQKKVREEQKKAAAEVRQTKLKERLVKLIEDATDKASLVRNAKKITSQIKGLNPTQQEEVRQAYAVKRQKLADELNKTEEQKRADQEAKDAAEAAAEDARIRASEQADRAEQQANADRAAAAEAAAVVPTPVADTGTTDTAVQEPVLQNPLTKVAEWAKGKLDQWFTVDPNNTVDQWVEKIKALAPVTVRNGDSTVTVNIYEDLYVPEMKRVKASLMGGNGRRGILKDGIIKLNSAKADSWKDKVHGVGSYLWQKLTRTDKGVDGKDETSEYYEVPEEVVRAFAMAGVIVMYKNTASFQEIVNDKGELTREVRKEAWATDIAKVAMQLLGVKSKKGTSTTIGQGAFLAYGLSTVAALIENKNFEMADGFNREDTNLDNWTPANLANITMEGTEYATQLLVPEPSALKAARDYIEAIDAVQGVLEGERIWEVGTEAVTEVDANIQYSDLPASAAQQTAEKNLQGVEHTLFGGLRDMLETLDHDGIKKVLTGWYDALPKDDDGTVPITIKKWLKSQVIRLDAEIASINHYLKVTENGAKGLFYKYHIGLNGRPKTVMGPQNNKIIRDLFSSGKVELDLKNPAHMKALQITLAQAFGIKTDIFNADEVVEQWMAKNAPYAAKARAIQATKVDGKFDKAKLLAALKQDTAYSPRQLAALITYGEAMAAMAAATPEQETIPFTSHLMFEIDGKTNGAFNTEMFFGLAVHSEANLGQGGFFQGEHDATWKDRKDRLTEKTGGIDFYERLNKVAEFEFASFLAKKLNTAGFTEGQKNFLKGQLRLLEAAGLVEVDWKNTSWEKVYKPTPDSTTQTIKINGFPSFTFKRDAAKLAVIPIQYGAGVTGISNQLWSDVITKINANWVKLYNQLQNTTDQMERRTIMAQMGSLAQQLEGWDSRNKDAKNIQNQNEKFAALRWQRTLANLAEAMSKAYRREKPIVQHVTGLLVSLTNFGYDMKKAQWDAKVMEAKLAMPENQELIAKFGKNVRLFDLSPDGYRQIMRETLDLSFSAFHAPNSISLNQTEWASNGVNVSGVGTSMDANLDIPTLSPVGVSVLALTTIANGDAAMGTEYFQKPRRTTHVFDGYDMNMLDLEQDGADLNAAVWATAGFDVLNDFSKLIARMEIALSQSSDELKMAMLEAHNAQLPGSVPPLEDFGQWLQNFRDTVEAFQVAHKAQKNGWDNLQAQPNTVYQMGGGGAHNTTVVPLDVRTSASLDNDFQLSLEEDAPRQETVDLAESGTREAGNFPNDYKHPEATRIEDKNGFIDVIMKGPRWKGRNTKTVLSEIVDGKSAGLRRLLKVLFMAAEAGVAYDSDKSVHPSAVRMYMRGKRMGLLTFESRYTDQELDAAGAGTNILRTDNNPTDDGEPVFRNVRLLGRNSLGALKTNSTLQTGFEVSNNVLNRARIVAVLDRVQWKNPIQRAVWKRIRNLLPAGLEVKLATTQETWDEVAAERGIRRTFNSVSGVAAGNFVLLRQPSTTVLLHELLHTVFTQHIDNFFSNINAVPVELRGPINDLVQLMNKFKKLPAVGRVGFVQKVMNSYDWRGQPQDELGEMLAYVFSEDEVIEELSPGFIQRVINRVKQILSFIVKLPAKEEFYNEAMDVFRTLADSVPLDADLVDANIEHISEHAGVDGLESLRQLSAQAFIDLISKASRDVSIDLRGVEAETATVLAQAQTAFNLDPNQQLLFNRIYMLLRKGQRPAELDQFVQETFTKHSQKNLFNSTPDVVAAVMALTAVQPIFAAQLDHLWIDRAPEGRVDGLIDRALNHAQANSSAVMLNNAVAAQLLEQDKRDSLWATASHKADRLGNSMLNRLGAKATKLSETAPRFADSLLQGIGALLNEKDATAFGEALLGYVNTEMDQRWLQDLVAALAGTKGSGKLIYRAHNAMMSEINRIRSMFDNTLPRELAKLFPEDFEGWTTLFDSFGRLGVQVLGTSTAEMYLNDAERRRMITVLESKVDNYIDAQNLGYYLVYRQPKPGIAQELLSNARAIADNLNGTRRTAPDSLVADADQLTTLYAIEYLAASERAKVADYFRQHPDSMNKLVGMLKHVSDSENQHARNEYRYAYWKDSLPLSMDPRSSVVIANAIRGAQLMQLGYIRKEKYPQSSGDPESDLYYYVRKYTPPPTFSQGIVATVQQTNMGVNYVTAASVTPETGTMITDPAVVSYIQRTKGRNSTLRAIYNFEGELVGYERMLDPKIVRAALGANNTQLHVSIGKKLGRMTEEALARRINQEAIKGMVAQWKDGVDKGRANEYEQVDSSPNKQTARAWETIPADIKKQLQDTFNGPVMIRKDLIANTLGYHNIGALEIFTGDATLNPETRKMLLGVIQTVFFGPRGTQIFLAAEQAIKEGVATARDLIIVRSLVVAYQNAQASLHLVIANGVPPTKIVKWYHQGIREMRAYNELQRQVMALRIEIAGTTDPTEKERLRTLQTGKLNSIKRLSIFPLIEAGELTDLPEGLEDQPSHSYLGDLAGWMDKHLREKIHPKAPKYLANALFAKDTMLHEAISKTIQAGDFLGRYAVYQHMIEKGSSIEKARNTVRDEFVSYQANPGRMRAGLETYGMIWWSQFTLRAQNVLLNRFRQNPFSFFVSQGLGDFLGTPGPLNGNIFERGLDNSTGYDQVWNSYSSSIYAKAF